jgi:nucleotide-binding universal stress UspA family protein
MFDNVVVGVRDFGADRRVLWLARALASDDGRLALAHVQVVRSKLAPDSGAVRYAARRRYALERLAALRDESQLNAEVVCEEARSVRCGLHDLVCSRRADLLVIGASRQDDVARDLVGDDTRELFEDAPCPVAVASLGYTDGRALRKIGVAYDGSPQSDEAVALARTLAADRQAKLSAFHAVRAPVHVRDPGDVGGEIDEDVAKAREQIEKLGGVEAHAEYGETLEELVRYGRSVDLLVLGSHEYSPVDRLLAQSTAQRLADEAPCPLLVLSGTS